MQWIDDDERWLAMMADRNLTVHTYNEILANQVYNRLADYVPLFKALASKLDEKVF